MSIHKGIFSNGSSFEDRNISDYDQLQELSGHWKALGLKIVLTAGSWDLIHEGHALYLEKARSYGDLLIVGVDSDEKIRARKGKDRPIVPQEERMRMLTHLRCVDVVTLKEDGYKKWALIKTIRPDILVATRETYTEEQIAELESKYCKRVIVHERMATTSTSARLRLVQIGLVSKLSSQLASKLPDLVRDVLHGTIENKQSKNASGTDHSWQKK